MFGAFTPVSSRRVAGAGWRKSSAAAVSCEAYMQRELKLIVVAGFALAAVSASRHRAVTPPPITGPTFSNEVVRILQANCQTCHHPGDIAPFSMMTYADTLPHAADMKLMTKPHQMPPW